MLMKKARALTVAELEQQRKIDWIDMGMTGPSGDPIHLPLSQSSSVKQMSPLSRRPCCGAHWKGNADSSMARSQA